MSVLDPHLYYLIRPLPDGRTAGVIPLVFDRARIVVWSGPTDISYDDLW
jgi:hypothetical protein